MMGPSYNCVCEDVNNHDCLTNYNLVCNFQTMKFGERLKAAREYARMTQGELIKRLGGIVTQQNISKLENGDATGSEFTVQIAIACGVRPEWLAMESGEMTDGLYVHNEKLKRLLMVAQELPDYAMDIASQEIDSIVELVRKTQESEQRKKG